MGDCGPLAVNVKALCAGMVDDLISLLFTLGTSVWGWLGVFLGFLAAYLAWECLPALQGRGVVSAVVFVAVFMGCAWQELRRKK